MKNPEDCIQELGYVEIPFTSAAQFFLGLKKRAQIEPDVTGQLEGQFTAPVEEVAQAMSQIVANEFKTQIAYLYYANTLRSLAQDAVAKEFEEHAEQEVEHAKYLLRRLSVLLPGGLVIPSPEMPEPLSDPGEIIKRMIAYEQQGIALWRQLHSMMGDNPTRFSIEQFMTNEQEHLDELWQLLPEGVAAEPSQSAPVSAEPEPEAAPVKQSSAKLLKAASLVKKANEAAMSVEDYMAMEQQLDQEQAKNELEHARGHAEQVSQQAAESNQRAMAAEQTAAVNEQRAQMAQQQAQMAQQQAAQASQQAAEEANQKLRLKMRIDEMRQALADLAAYNPTTDEAGSPEPGMPQPSPEGLEQGQDQMQQDPNAQQQQQPQQGGQQAKPQQPQQMQQPGQSQQKGGQQPGPGLSIGMPMQQQAQGGMASMKGPTAPKPASPTAQGGGQ